VPAIAAGAVCGIGIEAGVAIPAAANEFAEGGVAPTIELAGGTLAGAVLAAVTDCGVDCVEGNGGADLATSELLSEAVSCFQNAQRGPDWQPARAQAARTTNHQKLERCFIAWLPLYPTSGLRMRLVRSANMARRRTG
jgi:hypothetical protein